MFMGDHKIDLKIYEILRRILEKIANEIKGK